MRAWAFRIPFVSTAVSLTAFALLLFAASPASATDGDIFPAGTYYGALTYYDVPHPTYSSGTLGSFGASIDINGTGSTAVGELTPSFTDENGWAIHAPEAGTVTKVSTDNGSGTGWGNAIVWTRADGKERLFMAHLSAFGKTGAVASGDVIGNIGNTGESTGPHLHIERQANGSPAPVVLSGVQLNPGDSSYTWVQRVYRSKGWLVGVPNPGLPPHLLANHRYDGYPDFNGDGKTDMFRATGSQWDVSYGGTSVWTKLNGSAYTVDNLGFGDFNGDGKTDIFKPTGSQWDVSFGGTSAWTMISGSDYKLDRLALGDFNGDGTTDVFKPTGSQWDVSFGGTSSWTQISGSDYRLDALALGDFNGDGTTDVLRPTGEEWVVSFGSAYSSWSHISGSNYRLDRLAVGDFNGDGTTDVFRPTGEEWVASYGTAFASWAPLNNSTYELDRLSFGDLNGDGKTDVYRSSGSGWAVSYGGASGWTQLNPTGPLPTTTTSSTSTTSSTTSTSTTSSTTTTTTTSTSTTTTTTTVPGATTSSSVPSQTTSTSLPQTTTTTAPGPTPTQRFTDVSPANPYYTAVQAMAALNIVAGYPQPDGTAQFRPNNPLLRAQMAKLICGAFGLAVSEDSDSSFADMGLDNPEDLYPHNYVAAAKNAGVIEGKSLTSFDPWTNVTRAQMVTMIVRAAGSLFPGRLTTPPSTYSGALGNFDSSHAENMRVAEYNGLLHGVIGFGPSWNPWAPSSRGEVSQVLYNWRLKAGLGVAGAVGLRAPAG